jgi:hypothetical protein
MREGAKALIDRLGYANAARFIAILGGGRFCDRNKGKEDKIRYR